MEIRTCEQYVLAELERVRAERDAAERRADLLSLRTFREVRDDKAQALKPLEEAAEAFGAWQDCDDMRFSMIMTARRAYRDDLIDECLDTVQATVNLLAAVGATQGEVDAAIRRMDERNLSRGRL